MHGRVSLNSSGNHHVPIGSLLLRLEYLWWDSGSIFNRGYVSSQSLLRDFNLENGNFPIPISGMGVVIWVRAGYGRRRQTPFNLLIFLSFPSNISIEIRVVRMDIVVFDKDVGIDVRISWYSWSTTKAISAILLNAAQLIAHITRSYISWWLRLPSHRDSASALALASAFRSQAMWDPTRTQSLFRQVSKNLKLWSYSAAKESWDLKQDPTVRTNSQYLVVKWTLSWPSLSHISHCIKKLISVTRGIFKIVGMSSLARGGMENVQTRNSCCTVWQIWLL